MSLFSTPEEVVRLLVLSLSLMHTHSYTHTHIHTHTHTKVRYLAHSVLGAERRNAEGFPFVFRYSPRGRGKKVWRERREREGVGGREAGVCSGESAEMFEL